MAKSFIFKRGQTILFDGDSLTSRRHPPSMDTWPYLHLMNWQDSYADHISRLLFCIRPDLRLNFHNAAIGGSNIINLLDRFDRLVLPHKPNWIIMTIGPNDASQKMPITKFENGLIKYITLVKEKCAGKVIFVGGFKPCPNYIGDKKASLKNKAYYRILQKTAKKTGSIYIDAGTGLQKKATELYKQHPIHTVYGDGHFNAVGNIIIAMEVLGKLGLKL